MSEIIIINWQILDLLQIKIEIKAALKIEIV